MGINEYFSNMMIKTTSFAAVVVVNILQGGR